MSFYTTKYLNNSRISKLMEPLFYFFGIRRKEKMFILNDPIIIDNSHLYDLDVYALGELFEEKSLKLKDLVEELGKERGILFGVAKNSERITEFLKFGKFLSPEIIEENFSIYFLKDEKSILFKINKIYHSWKELKKDIWKILEPLNIFSKEEFRISTKDWEDSEHNPEAFSFETKKFKLCIGKFYYSFIYIKPKNYNQLKNKIKGLYKK